MLYPVDPDTADDLIREDETPANSVPLSFIRSQEKDQATTLSTNLQLVVNRFPKRPYGHRLIAAESTRPVGKTEVPIAWLSVG